MKKHAPKTVDALDGPVDFDRFGRMRRNAFAGAGEPGGPSLLALWEMPELANDALLLRRGHRDACRPARMDPQGALRYPVARRATSS